MINKTLGVGGDYTSWTGVRAALQGQTLSDDMTITQISNVTFTNPGTIDVLHLNGFTLRFTSALHHNGDPTSGYRTVYPNNSERLLITAILGSGTLEFDNLYYRITQSGTTCVQLANAPTNASTIVKVHDCLFISDAASSNGTNAFVCNSIFLYKSWNCVLYKAVWGGGSGVAGTTCENITVFDGTISAASEIIARNCYSTAFSNLNAASTHNASENTSAPGSGSLTNVVRANQFISTDIASPYFAKLTSSSVLIHSGITPVLPDNVLGLGGNTRPGDSFTSIGADEFASFSACISDFYGYTATATSHPWATPLGDPTVESDHLRLTYNDILTRDSFNGTGGWGITFTLKFNTTVLNRRLYHWISYKSDGSADFLPMPSFYLNASQHLILYGKKFPVSNDTAFGTWDNYDLGLVTDSDTPITVRFAYQSTAKLIAAVATLNGVSVSSGWVSVATGILNYQTVAFGVDNTGSSGGDVANIYAFTWRPDLTDTEVDLFYRGAAICGTLRPDAYQPTSSSPWTNRNKAHRANPAAKAPTLHTAKPSASKSTNKRPSENHDAKDPSIQTAGAESSASVKSKPIRHSQSAKNGKGAAQANGYISVIPNLSSMHSPPVYGSGQRIQFDAENLTTGKEFFPQEKLGKTRGALTRASLPVAPKGGYRMYPSSNDCLTTLMSHFQLRHGSNLSGGTTYYEFTPNNKRMTFLGSAYGSGTYGNTDVSSFFSVNVTKLVNGTGYEFRNGICDKLSLNFGVKTGFTMEPDYYFKSVSLTGSASLGSTGTYSTLPKFTGQSISATMFGQDIIGLQLVSDNALKPFKSIGTSAPYYGHGKYNLQGKATIDLSKVSLAYLGSMLGTQSFSIVGTLFNDERDKIVFSVPNCLTDDFTPDINSNTLEIPFKAYESVDGGTAPIQLKIWTRNYSGTSFEPN